MRIYISGLVAAVTGLLLGIGSAVAEPLVTLTANDGSTEVKGELLGFDGQKFTVRTGLGTIDVDASQVTCSGEGCPVQVVRGGGFDIEGSNIVGDGLIPALVEGYADTIDAEMVRQVGARENERLFRLIDLNGEEVTKIGVKAHGTATAFPAMAEGDAALGLASRRIAGAEAGLPDLRDTADEHILALDGLIVIVHPENPLRALTLDQIAAVFAGRVSNWAELGGPDQPINLYVPDSGSGTRDSFVEMVMRPRGLQMAAGAEAMEDHADLSDLVSIDPSGIGLTGFAYARASRMLAIRQLCNLISFPTSFAMKTEEYPLARRLYAYENSQAQSASVAPFLEFALSDAAQPIVAEAGFVDRGIENQGIEVQGTRLAHSLTSPGELSLAAFREMLTELKFGERLSITFRFTPGSSDLETRSQSEAVRFAGLLASGAYSGKEILLVGFTDLVGDANVNRGLSERRAQSVLDTLKASVAEGAIDDVPIIVRSYGEFTPVGCNETAGGRELNRRVEVWIREKRG